MDSNLESGLMSCLSRIVEKLNTLNSTSK